MAIKDLFSRKSVSSSSSGGQTEATTTTTNTSDDAGQEPVSPTAQRPSNRLAKTWSWRSNRAFKEEKKPKPKPKPQKQRLHPSERPLTEMNLRHQEILSSFTFNFGRRKGSNGGRRSFASGISPGNSRQGSLDQSAGSPGMGPVRGDRRVSSFAHDVPREDPRAEAEAEP